MAEGAGYNVSFNLLEWLAITGFAQSVFILVYMLLRIREWRQALVAFFYFFCLLLGFALQFSLKIESYTDALRLVIWAVWSLGPPLSFLLILQVTHPASLPDKRYFLILLIVPLAALGAFVMARMTDICSGALLECQRFHMLLYWTSAISGGLTMLGVWTQRDIFAPLRRMRGGNERYWLVLTLIAVNVGSVLLNFLFSTGSIDQTDNDILRMALGILFAYLAMTTLFRVYPLPLSLSGSARLLTQSLSEEDKKISDRVRQLLESDKVYQESNYGRTELAREVGVSESVLSRVINTAFGKTVPQLLGEYRVEDAKQLLKNPQIPVNVVAQEAGFNSLASFNRIFRDLTGETPSGWREMKQSVEKNKEKT